MRYVLDVMLDLIQINNNPMEWYYYLHFRSKETKAQRI